MKSIVCHFGSRRSYAVPSAFARAGKLSRFYTDICGSNGLGRLAKPISRITPFGRRSAQSLAFRIPPPEVVELTTTFDVLGLYHKWRTSNLSSVDHLRRWDEAIEAFGRAIISRGFGDANHFYSLMHEAGPALREARRRGLKTAADVYITPSWDKFLAEEHRRFPDWGDAPITFRDALGTKFRPYARMVDNADLLVCPSLFVRNDLIDNFGIALERTAIVPYAVSRQWLELDTHPERGRVLFLGTADLRKGIHHFAMAARKLRAEGDNYEFVVAGGVTPEMREKGEAMGLTFLGRVPRSEIAAELQRADIVVLPSIAEGSAGATYEALAAGIPLVVSAAAGSVARDGVDGVVMDEPSADLIAEAVGAIVADRALRASMSAAAQQRAREFTWDRFGTRLISALLF